MARAKLVKDAGFSGISKTLSEILVCPLSKQPLRVCEESGSLISDSIGVSFPKENFELLAEEVKDGIPCLMPQDGKILETEDTVKRDTADDSDAAMKKK